MKANKTEIRKQIKSLEAMRKCKTKEFNMDSYVRAGDYCETALCIAGDVVARRLGLKKAEDLLLKINGTKFGKVAQGILRLKGNNLFHVSKWSAANSEAYTTAMWDRNQSGMIDAGIAELKRYL